VRPVSLSRHSIECLQLASVLHGSEALQINLLLAAVCHLLLYASLQIGKKISMVWDMQEDGNEWWAGIVTKKMVCSEIL
jgi:hypothetical protein